MLADPVERTQRYAPHGRYISISGAGHFSHEEAPEEINRHLMRFLEHVHDPGSADAGPGVYLLGVADLGKLTGHLLGRQYEAGVRVVDGGAEHHAEHPAIEVDQRPTRIALLHIGSDGVDVAGDRLRAR